MQDRKGGKQRHNIWKKLSNNLAHWLRMRKFGLEALEHDKMTNILSKLAKNENFWVAW